MSCPFHGTDYLEKGCSRCAAAKEETIVAIDEVTEFMIDEKKKWRRDLIGKLFLMQLEVNLQRNETSEDMPFLCAQSSIKAVETLLEALERAPTKGAP